MVAKSLNCFAMAGAIALLPICLVAQPQQTLIVTNFSAPQFYPPPNQAQLKSLLQGSEGRTLPAGKMLVEKAKLQTFKENGEHELLILAPQCVYDSGQRTASSAGPIRGESADGRFLTEGEGFLWRQTGQTNSSLFISNKVHTFVQGELMATPPPIGQTPAQKGEPIDIFADRFSYESETGQGIYRDHVRVTGTNLNLTSGVMTVLVPMKERELKTIDAEQDVTISYKGVSAHGDKAVYSAVTGLADVLGNPTWKADQRDGGAEKLTIDRSNQVFTATGKAWLELKGQKLADVNGLAQPPSARAQSVNDTNHTIVISSDRYVIKTNSAKFDGTVLAQDKIGEATKSTMQCEMMTVDFAGTNELQQLVADKNVIIEQEDSGFTSGKAFYTGADRILELTDNPLWRSGSREGKGDVLRIDANQNKLTANGHAFMRLPASESGQPVQGSIKSDPKATNGYAEIFSKTYELKAQEALFRGDVRLEHPRMSWRCEEVTVQGTNGEDRKQRMVARQSVAFDLLSPNGEKVHGTCEQAVYDYNVTAAGTNETVELTGNPVIETTNATLRNAVIVMDRSNNKIYVPGKYRMYGTVNPTMTNELRLPPIRKR
jgi:lipopolysaccharide export system protein LptA